MSDSSMARTMTYGYVPLSFPRDPAEVNLFPEHIVLGQILEPVVDTDKLGNVIPGIAESWTFENNGLTIRLKIKKNRKFSNGKNISSKDIKYTIDRMIKKKSQSSNFLTSIYEVKEDGPNSLVIKLKEANVATLKALSRDQMGIVPFGWNFTDNLNEPLIGSGPYRLIKEKADWFLIENKHYQGLPKSEIKKWKLVFSADADGNIPKDIIPDYAPAITSYAKKNLEQIIKNEKIISTEQLSFAQTSAWWHPSGAYYLNDKFKIRAMSLVEKIMSDGTKKLSLERATGVIPKGVAGHLTSNENKHLRNEKNRYNTKDKLRIGTVGSIFDDLIANINLDELSKRYGFTVEIIKIPPTALKEISSSKIDIIFAGWAGGFNDPEGFIALLPTYLGKDFLSYIGPNLAEIYQNARLEQNWTKRSKMFQEINKGLKELYLMTPGWKIPFYIAGKPSLISQEATFRYTPRLQWVKEIIE